MARRFTTRHRSRWARARWFLKAHTSAQPPTIIFSEAFPTITNPVVIGANAWIAARSIVLPGVTVGENSVVGAGSVVTKNVPPDVVCAGNPARVIKSIPARKST